MRAFYFTRDENLATKPEVLQIRRATGLSAADVVFHIEEFWRYVNQLGYSLGNASGQGILPGYQLADLPLLVGLNDDYWSAVVSVGWIELSPDGALLIPGFDARFGKLAQRRMAATRRQQRSRANKSARAVATAALETKQPDARTSTERQVPQRRRNVTDSQRRTATNHFESIAPTAAEHCTAVPNAAGEFTAEPSIAPPITPERSSTTPATSQFDLLTASDLAVCGKLLCWMADIATMRRPVVLNDSWHQVRVVAAGIRATAGVGVKEPLALFKSIVGKARWTMLEPEDLKTAQLRLSSYQRGTLMLHTDSPQRAGPDDDQAPAATMLANGFGAIPQPTRQPGAKELLQWEQQRKARTG